jgi:hypothetical protein
MGSLNSGAVTTVALAAYEELKITSGRDELDMSRDKGLIAVNLVRILVVSRQSETFFSRPYEEYK